MIDRLVAIKLNDMREELPGFEWNPVVEKEFAFDKQIELVVVRILTTIPRLENYGEEFIRVCMHDAVSMKLMVFFRIPRTDRWKTTLRERIAQVMEEALRVVRCECGGLVYVQRGVYGRYEACTKCNRRRSIIPTDTLP